MADLNRHRGWNAGQIRAAQVRLLYRNAASAVIVTLLVAWALSYLQWDVIPRPTLLGWLAYMAAVSACRLVLAHSYSHRDTEGNRSRGWETAFVIGAALSASGWGAAGVFLYPPGHLLNQVFLVFVLGGMMLGGGAILSARPEAFLAFLIPTGLPVTIRFLIDGDSPHLVMGLLLLLFTAATLITTIHVYQAVADSLGFRFENAGLVAELQVATQRLEVLNQELESRVVQRTAELDQTVSRLTAEIAERRRAEEERAALEASLRHTQKLEAIGDLSGGLAHEFNNLLTSIGGYSALLREPLGNDPEALRNLEDVLKATDRATNLVQRLLVFSRKTEHKPKLIPVADAVSEALELVRSSLPPGITLRSSVDSGCGFVFADPNLIQLIVVNLCTNANDAMSGQAGLLEVTLAPVEFGGREPAQPGLADGAYVKLTVRDTGTGIPAEIADRVFDPFFTTKSPGTATGLGLSVVHGIVATYGGLITFESPPPAGTRFVVLLPRQAAPEKIRPEVSEAGPTPALRILFVDDEEAIARLGALMLRRLGHRVTAMTRGAEALRLFVQQPDSFDLVITDLTMPQMTGKELIRELRDIRPDLPVILMSGFNDPSLASSQGQPPGAEQFLGKPFSRITLQEAISRVLRKRRNSAAAP